FLVFLLCFSLHGSHARRLGVIDRKLENKSRFSNKNVDKENIDSISKLPKGRASLTKELEATKGYSVPDTWAYNNAQKQNDPPKAKQKILNEKEIVTKSSGVNKSKRLVSVSWRVPHKKRGEEKPDFNLDYASPKTHPPSHN
ncbi:hypothetical protein CFOL_v3_15281, partial [Cephalotus follicularis]